GFHVAAGRDYPPSHAVRDPGSGLRAAAAQEPAHAHVLSAWPSAGGFAQHAGFLAPAGAMEVGARAAGTTDARAVIRRAHHAIPDCRGRSIHGGSAALGRGLDMVRASLPAAPPTAAHSAAGMDTRGPG